MVCWCIVRGCSTNVDKKGLISFHKFPSDLKQRQLWVDAINSLNKQFLILDNIRAYTKICSKHFGTSVKRKNNNNMITLALNAVPSIFASNTAAECTSAPTIMLRVSDNQSAHKFAGTACTTKSPSSEIVPDDHNNSPKKYKHVAYIRSVDSKLILKNGSLENGQRTADCSIISKSEQDPLSNVVAYNNRQRSISCQTDAKEYSQILRIKKAIGKTAQLKNLYRHRLLMANKKIAEMKKIIADAKLNASLCGDADSYDDHDDADDALEHWIDAVELF